MLGAESLRSVNRLCGSRSGIGTCCGLKVRGGQGAWVGWGCGGDAPERVASRPRSSTVTFYSRTRRAPTPRTPPLADAPMAQFVFESDLHSLLQLDAPIPNAPPARWQRKAKEAAGPVPSPMRAANRSHSAGRTPGRTPGQWGAAGHRGGRGDD